MPLRPNKATRDLRRAVRAGNVLGVISALESGANANEKDTHGAPPLLNAVLAGHGPVVQALLAYSADPNTPLWGEAENTILMWAVRSGRADSAVALVNAGARVSPWVFKDAAERGITDAVRAMLEGGTDVNAVSSDGTALMAAAYRGNASMVRLLLERNADPNVSMENGWVALMSAAAMGHAVAVGLLLESGANPLAHDKNGDTAMKFAAEAGHSEVVQVLSDAGAGT